MKEKIIVPFKGTVQELEDDKIYLTTLRSDEMMVEGFDQIEKGESFSVDGKTLKNKLPELRAMADGLYPEDGDEFTEAVTESQDFSLPVHETDGGYLIISLKVYEV